jgi:hypothetical protein
MPKQRKADGNERHNDRPSCAFASDIALQEEAPCGQMITDQTKTSTDLKGFISSGDLKAEIPAALDDSSQKIDRLKDAKPIDFSSDFDSMQLSAHKDDPRPRH